LWTGDSVSREYLSPPSSLSKGYGHYRKATIAMSPDPDVEAAAETGAQTRADCPEEHLAPADVAQEMTPEEADSVQLSQLFGGMFLTAWTIAQRAVESSPSKAYAQFLIERGVKPAWARGLASLMISRGVRLANENKRLPAVVGAIRFLAKPGRGRKAMARKAEVLLAAWEETSIIETIFDSAGLSASDGIVTASPLLSSSFGA